MPSTPSSSSGSEGSNRASVARRIAFVLILAAVPTSVVVGRLTGSHDLDPKHSGPAPAFTRAATDGSTVSLASLAGRPLVVNFFGAWCEQCINELPLLTQMHARYPGVAIVGILYRESPEAGRTAADHGGATWPILVDPDESVADAWGVSGAPATFFVRADGTIAGDLLGPVSIGLLEKQFRKISPTPPS
ncbi:MAG TPA: TlpA disulfide reductase family protein [Acidimicrobiia bacterium]|nr:TlpA disulfide reductase family protein [Acidimicrobiia bacterium]